MTISLEHSGSWTVDDVEEFPEDNRRRELVEGSLILRAAPTNTHQTVVVRLACALDDTRPENYHVNHGMQVRFSDDTACVPDIVVVRQGGWTAETSYFPHTHVELAVEICEEGSKRLDRGLKPMIYAAAGIPSFWRIDLDERLLVHIYRLDSAREAYEECGVYEDTLQAHEPWSLTVPIKKLTPRYLRAC